MAAYGGSVGGGGSSGTSSDEGRSRFEAFFPGPEVRVGVGWDGVRVVVDEGGIGVGEGGGVRCRPPHRVKG